MKLSLSDNRYPAVKLRKDGRSRDHKVHVLVMAAFIGPRPDGYEIDHKNTFTTDARLRNLEYVTKSENNKRKHADYPDMFRGMNNPNSLARRGLL